MKRTFLLLILLMIGLCVKAQSVNVNSAYSDLNRGYLNKAKAEIDAACKHYDTKNDAKTWYYAGLIYCRIGADNQSSRPQYSDLAPDWCTKAIDALRKCKQLDNKREYSQGCKGIEDFVKGNCEDLVSNNEMQKTEGINSNNNVPELQSSTHIQAQYDKQSEVSLIVSADGATKTEAVNNALRLAIEQSFGTFVSANTEILNDQLVKDEIATISSGNIQKFKEIAAIALPNGNTSVTLNVTVSLKKLVKYAQSKGSECEFAGATFGANLRLYEFNKKNEEIAIQNMIKQLDALRPAFDYDILVSDPVIVTENKNRSNRQSDNEQQAKINVSVKIIPNEKTKLFKQIFQSTIMSLGMTKEQIALMEKDGHKFFEYLVVIDDKESRINNSIERDPLLYFYNPMPNVLARFMWDCIYDYAITDNMGGIYYSDIAYTPIPAYTEKAIGPILTCGDTPCWVTSNNRIRVTRNVSTRGGYYRTIKNIIFMYFGKPCVWETPPMTFIIPVSQINQIGKISIRPTKTERTNKITGRGNGRYPGGLGSDLDYFITKYYSNITIEELRIKSYQY